MRGVIKTAVGLLAALLLVVTAYVMGRMDGERWGLNRSSEIRKEIYR